MGFRNVKNAKRTKNAFSLVKKSVSSLTVNYNSQYLLASENNVN